MATKKESTAKNTVTSEKIRIRLKAYDHVVLEQSAEKIVDTAKKTGAKVSGPIPLPTKKEVVTILRSPHKHKDSREQFEMRTHKRVIDILYPNGMGYSQCQSYEHHDDKCRVLLQESGQCRVDYQWHEEGT